MRPNKLKTMWQAGQTALNAWLTLPSAWSAEVLAHAGFDALTIDMQHGLADYSTAVAMLQALSTTEATPLVRVPWNEPGVLMRLLDAGAYGLICPMVNTRAEAEAFVGACRYPPLGYRSYGPIRAAVYAGEDYLTHANDTVLTLAMIETAEALANLDEILAVDGLDGVYVGTFDLSISMGLPDLGNLDNPALREAMDRIVAAATARRLVAGVHASSPASAALLSQWGFRLITPVNDTTILRSAATQMLEETRKRTL